jgi:hypothetical protein
VSRLLSDRRLSRGELLLAWGGLAIVAALAFIPHIRHGGFYLDDWSNAAGALQPPGGPGVGNALSYFADLTIYRPVLVVYVPALYFAFGMSMDLHLIWSAFLALCVAGLLYGVLRTVGVPWFHAWAIAALTLVYPWFDSVRLWATASQISLSVALALGGLWLALAALRRPSWRWHLGAAALYLLSILTYEVTLPLIAAAGLLYVLRSGWAAARGRWAIDLAVVVAGAAWVGSQTKRETSSFSDNLEHLEQIVSAGGTLLGRTLLPVGAQQTTLALAFVAFVLLAGLATLVLLRREPSGGSAWGLREWLLLSAGGLAVAALGWFMFIPADPYYTPSVYGMTNRVNGLAGLGLVIAVYGCFGVLGNLIGQLRPQAPVVAVAVTLALGGALGIGFVDTLRRHITIWDAAFVAERAAIDQLRTEFPRLRPETTLFVGGYPANQTLGVTILGATWDLDGMVKSEYEDGTLWAYPVLPGLRLACLPQGVRLVGEGAPPTTPPYGKALLVQLPTGERARPRSRAQCREVADRYVPGPLYLSYSY